MVKYLILHQWQRLHVTTSETNDAYFARIQQYSREIWRVN